MRRTSKSSSMGRLTIRFVAFRFQSDKVQHRPPRNFRRSAPRVGILRVLFIHKEEEVGHGGQANRCMSLHNNFLSRRNVAIRDKCSILRKKLSSREFTIFISFSTH